MMAGVIACLLGLYLLLEAINQMALMDGGDRACRVAKYVLAALSGLMLATQGWVQRVDWLHLVMACTIALFVWPKMVTRMHHIFKFERRRLDRRA